MTVLSHRLVRVKTLRSANVCEPFLPKFVLTAKMLYCTACELFTCVNA